jgi:hypothetical protein
VHGEAHALAEQAGDGVGQARGRLEAHLARRGSQVEAEEAELLGLVRRHRSPS